MLLTLIGAVLAHNYFHGWQDLHHDWRWHERSVRCTVGMTSDMVYYFLQNKFKNYTNRRFCSLCETKRQFKKQNWIVIFIAEMCRLVALLHAILYKVSCSSHGAFHGTDWLCPPSFVNHCSLREIVCSAMAIVTTSNSSKEKKAGLVMCCCITNQTFGVLEQFLNECRKLCLLILFYFALWLDKKVRTTFSTNQKLNQNQSSLPRTRFAALDANHLYLFQFLIGPFCVLFLLWSVRVITLVLVLRHSYENRSKVEPSNRSHP